MEGDLSIEDKPPISSPRDTRDYRNNLKTLTFPAETCLLDYLARAGPTYVARNGIVCMVDYLRSENDPQRYTPSCTCVPFRSTEAASQASAEDVAFMMDGYCRALFLLNRIVEADLPPTLRRQVVELLQADERHMSRYNRDRPAQAETNAG